VNFRIVLYFLFAGVATGINLGVQWFCTQMLLQFYPVSMFPEDTELIRVALIYWSALVAGTGIAAVVKYILDKLFVFNYKTDSLKKDIVAFLLYALMAVFTTAIFWGIQALFYFGFGLDKYIGGTIGLVAGYIVKFFLDRKFVFVERDI